MPFDQQLLHWDTHAHSYQHAGMHHLLNSSAVGGVAVLWLSPGYGKTTMTLHAFKALRDAGVVKNMLIIAPLRPAQTVWMQEVEQWASLAGLKAQLLHGPKKERWLARRDVDIWIINYEGIPWLAKLAKGGKLTFGFDVVVADEIRRFKNSQGTRFKAARPLFKLAKFKWGLTGTPASNGLMDLFGQFLILDDGKALGRTLTGYRMNYFEKGWDGFTFDPRPGAQDAIEERVAPYVFRTEGYLDLPEFVFDRRHVTLTEKARKYYTSLKNDLISSIEDTVITAANAAVLTGKLKQMANGRMYDENRNILKIHTAKQDALLELVEELGDEQLLIAYEYQHDLDQIREAIGDIPTLSGASEKVANQYVDQWNRNEIQFLAAYPGESHGLNIQKSGAHHILWFGPTFDLDHFIQFNDRLRRQGNTADSVVVHTFITENSVDEKADEAREGKDSLQAAFLSALTAELGGSITVDASEEGEIMSGLQFQNDQQQAGQTQQQAAGGNPFEQSGQAQQQNPQQNPQQGNPFEQGGGNQQPPAQGNPFGQTQQPPAGGNPFEQSGQAQQQQPAVNPMEQQQNIQRDVAAPPPPTANQAFAAHGVAMGSENPTGGGQPPQQQAPASTDSGWQTPAQKPIEDAQVVSESGPAHSEVAASAAAAGMVPLYTFVPADKLDKVMSAIGRAVKDK